MKPIRSYLISEREYSSIGEIATVFGLDEKKLAMTFSNAVNGSNYDIFRANGLLVTVLRDGLMRNNARVGLTGGHTVWRLCSCGNAFKIRYLKKCENCLNEEDIPWVWEVRKYSNLNKFGLPGIDRVTDENGFMINGYTIDHIVPLYLGKQLGLSSIEMSSIDNLQIMGCWDNTFDGGKGSMLPEKWINWITDKEWYYSIVDHDVWFEFLLDLCIKEEISYIKASSVFLKTGALMVNVNGIKIERAPLAQTDLI